LKRIAWFLLVVSLLSCGRENSQKSAISTPGQPQLNSHQLVRDSSKPISAGHQQTIYLFADSDIWQKIEPTFTRSIQRVFYTTETEHLFDIRWSDIDKIKQLRHFKNLVFICDFTSDRPVATYVKSIMTHQAIDNAVAKKATMYMNDNLWANDQLVLFFMGENPTEINEYMLQNQDTYFQILYHRLIARILYQSQKTKPHPDTFFAGLPFTLSLPQSFAVFKSVRPENFISYIWRSRTDPDRNPDKYISVYWEFAPADPITREWLIAKRREIAWKYYDEDEFSDADITSGLKPFKGNDNWFLFGKWQNSKYYIGGAFQTFAYYDQKAGIAYLIDTSVYYPRGDKMIYLLELEGIAGSVGSRE